MRDLLGQVDFKRAQGLGRDTAVGRRKKKGSRPVDSEDARPGREESRRARREAGSRSAAAAHGLMELPGAAFNGLELEDELRQEVARSRAIVPKGARRREERRLAGILRVRELEQVEAELANVEGQGRADARLFKYAEGWRERLLDEATAVDEIVPTFIAEVGGCDPSALSRQVQDARRQLGAGRRGASRELFRQVMAALRASERARR